MQDDLKQRALRFHRTPVPGKLAIIPTKPLGTQRDLALAYSPGVAYACTEIQENPEEAATLTGRQNLVAVISNGTAVLGLGDIGGLASKPVMEGKAVLFKKFAGINVFDIELDEKDPEKVIEIVAALEPTFGAVNLEDIKSPDCFIIEEALKKRMNIPVFHDDQHGTAIVCGAALLNGLRVTGKQLSRIKLVSTGGGAAGIACLNLMVSMGVRRENIWLVDHLGLVHEGRTEEMTEQKAAYAQKTDLRGLKDVIRDADVFLGLSRGGVLTGDMVKDMTERPLIMALANPDPEIDPDEARAANSEAVICTGRSDYPNQVNNVLCFPFIFRGALDCGASEINEEMKIAAVKAIADLAMAESSETVASAYAGEDLRFGPEYILPKPFDMRLIVEVASAVAKAAMDSGAAKRPIQDFDAYRGKLEEFVFQSGLLMKPIFDKAKAAPKRLVFAEGEDRRVLRAVQGLLDEGMARPILIGRPDVVERRVEQLGLRLELGENVEICNPEDDPRYEDYWREYHALMERDGVSPDAARTIVRTNTTVIATMMLKRGEADAMICGTVGRYDYHLRYVTGIVGKGPGVHEYSALNVLLLPKGTFFLCDTQITENPTANELAEMTLMSADYIRRFGETPRVALLSHSSFGSGDLPCARKMRHALEMLHKADPELQVEGEMQADAAINENIRLEQFPNSRLKGQANLLVFPNRDAANTAFNLLKSLGNGRSIGPILIGADMPAHILTSSVTTRGILNMSAFAVVDAQARGR